MALNTSGALQFAFNELLTIDLAVAIDAGLSNHLINSDSNCSSQVLFRCWLSRIVFLQLLFDCLSLSNHRLFGITICPSWWPLLLGQLCADPSEPCLTCAFPSPLLSRAVGTTNPCFTTRLTQSDCSMFVCSDCLPLLPAAQIRVGTLVARSTGLRQTELDRHEQPVCWMVRTWRFFPAKQGITRLAVATLR